MRICSDLNWNWWLNVKIPRRAANNEKKYKIILTPEVNGSYTVFIPDFGCGTQGKNLADAMYMARDTIGIMGIYLQDMGKDIPEPGSVEYVSKASDILTYVNMDFSCSFRNMRNKVSMMSEEAIKYIVARVLDNANDAFWEATENKDDDFYKGKKLAYYEILDTIKNELKARDQNLIEFGLDINLEKNYL